jgi:peroxiredoxin
MKKIIVFAFSFCMMSSDLEAQETPSKPKSNLKLSIDLTSIAYPLDKVFLNYYNTSTKERFVDSVDAKLSRNVVFNIFLPEPLLATVRVVPDKQGDTSRKARTVQPRDVYSIFLEPGNVYVVAKDSLSNSTVKGSPSHTEYLDLKKQIAAYDDANKALYAQYSEARKNKDRAAADKIEKSIDSLQEVVNESVYLPYIKSRKNAPVALYALSQYAGYAIDPKKAEPLYEELGTNVKSLPAGVIFKEKLELAKKTEIGQYALPFSQTDTAGIEVSLASFKGKYVLIDFWASWCGPCRAENPNVVKAFNKHKDKGFTVLGISLDQPGAKEKWIKAIHDDQLTWTHVSDLKYWNNEVAKQYGIQAIPQNYLIDADGKIIGKNLRGEELQAKLEELFTGK